jgi:hypothetical protein
LPGITKVTDRARSYSFYPWVIWSFERRYNDHSQDEFRRVLRRAECLFALTTTRHPRQVADRVYGRHGKGMVGRDKLLRIDEASEFSLDEHSGLEGPNQYFKNKLAALTTNSSRGYNHHLGEVGGNQREVIKKTRFSLV